MTPSTSSTSSPYWPPVKIIKLHFSWLNLLVLWWEFLFNPQKFVDPPKATFFLHVAILFMERGPKLGAKWKTIQIFLGTSISFFALFKIMIKAPTTVTKIPQYLILKEALFWPILATSDHHSPLEWFADINQNPYPNGCSQPTLLWSIPIDNFSQSIAHNRRSVFCP